jgi:hypothetical protein
MMLSTPVQDEDRFKATRDGFETAPERAILKI